MSRFLWFVAGVLLGLVFGTLLTTLHAEPEIPDATVAAAEDAGVDPVDLAGAVNTTGLDAREYLYAVGELERPYTPPPARSGVPVGGGPFGLSPYLSRVAYCESRLNPGAVGRLGEIGLFQLLPGRFGLLPLFYQRGYTNPWNGWQQAAFAAWAFAHGYARAWTCA